jgi:ABC-type Fe3+ transport system permease subunit
LKRVIVIIAVAVTALALASGAFASALTNGHGSTPKSSRTLGAKVIKKSALKVNTLPFTGIDLGVAALGGIALLGVGFTLRRSSRKAS